MAQAETHMSEAPSHTPPPGQTTERKNEVQAKQGTDKPRGMPVVLIVSTVAAAVAMWIVWATFFG